MELVQDCIQQQILEGLSVVMGTQVAGSWLKFVILMANLSLPGVTSYTCVKMDGQTVSLASLQADSQVS
jgi:hypothetical protein